MSNNTSENFDQVNPSNPSNQVNPNLFIQNFYDSKNLELSTPFVVQGNILDENQQIICKGLPISKELLSWENIVEKYQEQKYFIRPFYEGSLLRVFHYSDKWNIATSRKLDAFQSKWGSLTSFGELFQNFLKKEYMMSLEDFFNSLKTEFVYYFLFTSESVFYIHPSSSSSLKLFFILNKNGERVTSEKEFVPYIEYLSFDSIHQKYLNNELLGVVLENESERYTLFSQNYEKRKKLYGTKKYLAQRILELLENNAERTEYTQYFPEAKKYFQMVEFELRYFCKKVHKTYMQRYIQKNFVEVEPAVNHFVKLLHANYKESKKVTNYQHVLDTFKSLSVDSKFCYIRQNLPNEIGGKRQD